MPAQKPSAPEPPQRPPTGRDEVVAAVIEAAAGLFSEMPVGQVTTRLLAERAQVNLGLIHRHCGTKEDVLHAVMERYAAVFRREVLSATDLTSALKTVIEDPIQAAFVRTLAFVVMSGTSLDAAVSKSGALKETIRLAQEDPEGAIDESVVLLAWSLLLGWHLFKPFLLRASETTLTDEDMTARVYDQVLAMCTWGRLGNDAPAAAEAAAAPAAEAARKPARGRAKG
jgi:AcrR family transcriptional regulator